MTESEKLMRTLEVFDEYERRFASARAARVLRRPWLEPDREDILRSVRSILGFREELIPRITIKGERITRCPGYTIRELTFTSWERFWGEMSLYTPDTANPEKLPLILVCPGHGADGRLYAGYQQMALNIVRSGASALLIENIGQGCRKDFGHWQSLGPLACGISLQGMILMETVAVIRRVCQSGVCDPRYIGACGNSGGGTLTTFLAALSPELGAVASTGYPSEFGYIFAKERGHCACNLLPGVLPKLEMWESLALMSPRPLYVSQGERDHLIPVEYFNRSMRKAAASYKLSGAPAGAFYAKALQTAHSWEEADRLAILAFFGRHFPMEPVTAEDPGGIRGPETVRADFPADALTTDECAANITGVQLPDKFGLEDIFSPAFGGKPLDPDTVCADLGRGSVTRVFAQMECALWDKPAWGLA